MHLYCMYVFHIHYLASLFQFKLFMIFSPIIQYLMSLAATGYGSSGWQAPEQLLHGRQTRAVDMFSLGCVLFYCITGGRHPFGDRLERDINIVKSKADLFLVEYIPEAVDLLSRLLDRDAELRYDARVVMTCRLFDMLVFVPFGDSETLHCFFGSVKREY